MATQFLARARQSAEPNSEPKEVPGLSDEQLAELRAKLDEKRATLASSIKHRKHDEQSIEGARDVGDEMDEATSEGNTAMASKLIERDVRLLHEIDHALSKMKDGTYGLCEGTEEPIGFARLRLQPWARYSISYQEELEREERGRGGRM